MNGTLFSLPAGDVHAALGSEWTHERYKEIQGTTVVGGQNTLIPGRDKRDVYAFFGEMSIPVFGKGFTLPMVHALNVSLSARYDHYSDFGATTNPRVGVTYEPIEWIDIRGDWGKSFQAPSLADTVGAAPTMVAFPGVIFQNPFAAPPPNLLMYELFLSGAVKGLQPETANSYSVGTEIRPPFIPNLDFGVTYYNIQFRSQVAQALPGINVPINQFWSSPALATTYPTPAQIAQFTAVAGAQGANVLAGLDPSRGVYSLLNTLRQNLSNSWLNGLDASAQYTHDTDFGSLYANLNGTYRLSNITQLGNGAPKSDNLANTESRFQFVTTLGAMIGDHIRAQVALNHLGGFSVPADSSDNFQSHVKSFNSTNLYFEYDLNGSGLTQDLSFSLSVNNVFDQDPSVFEGTYIARYDGYANPVASIGRLIQFGVDKKF
jgi:iron complex outermembrane receptor protein